MNEKMKSNHEKFKQKSAKKIYSQFPKVSKRQVELEKAAYLEELSKRFHLPADILAGVPLINMTGNHQLCLENYKGIIEYTSNSIKVQTKIGKLLIQGEKLNIDYFTEEEMCISGVIYVIKYQ